MQKKFTLANFSKVAIIFLAISMLCLFIFNLLPSNNAYALEEQTTEETVSVSNQVYLGASDINPPDPNMNQETAKDKYDSMRKAFYGAFNTYITPTLILFAVFMFVFAGTKLGIEMGKAEDDAKRAEIKKRMINWIIGIVVVMISPLLVQGIAEIAMGFASGMFTA